MGAKQATLTYDPLGRLWEVDGTAGGGLTTRFLYDGDALVAEYDDIGNLMHRYVHGVGTDVPAIWYEGAGVNDNTRLQLFANWQGSITTIMKGDESGEMVAINGYDSYGIANETNIGRFQYTGQITIPELGLYHYKARVYSPTLGRFLQTDPIGYEDQVNLYAYVANDPVNLVDPTGLYECSGDDCTRIAGFRDQLVEARDGLLESDLASDRRVGKALSGLLKILGTKNDRNGLTIKNGNLNANGKKGIKAGEFSRGDNTITLDFNAIRTSGQLGGAVLGHELVHKQDFDTGRLQKDTPGNYARRERGAHAVEHFIYRGYGTASPYQGRTLGESYRNIKRNVRRRCFIEYSGNAESSGNCFSAAQ